MRQVLIERFEFDRNSDDIVILAATEGEKFQPTRANIEREFLRLGRQVKKGETVVILLGGHGSQQPDDDPENPADQEPDGLDEVFLPSDVGEWEDETARVKNAIVDDEFRAWLGAITARDAFVWLIMDACHSGSGVRGGEGEVSRHIPPETLVPTAVLTAAESKLSQQQPDPSGDSQRSFFDGPGGLVAIYAAQSDETTPEKLLPLSVDRESRKYYGLLTYTLSEILTNNSRNLTYNELAQGIQNRYIAMGRRGPTPLIEGSHRDQLVLGQEEFPARSKIILTCTRSSARINAGSLNGVTKGSVLAVYPPVGISVEGATDETVIAYLRVAKVQLTESVVEATAYESEPAAGFGDLPNRGRCEIVFRDLGDQRLKVAVDPLDVRNETVPADVLKNIIAKLSAVESPLVSVVSETADSDWLVRWDDGEVHLIPTQGISTRDVEGHDEALLPHTMSGNWAARLTNDLEKIARAQNLLRLTDIADESSRGAGLGFELAVVDDDKKEIPWQGDGRVLEDGERVVVEMKNGGRYPVDVTLLYVDSAHGITCLYPDFGELNRIDPGDSQQIPLSINASTTGLENIIAIVVKADGQPVDFGVLEQSSIEKAQRNRGGSKTLDTPLGRLCQQALYGQGGTRGVSRTESLNYDVQRLTWRISPAESD